MQRVSVKAPVFEVWTTDYGISNVPFAPLAYKLNYIFTIVSKLKHIKVNYRKYNDYLTFCTNREKDSVVGRIMAPKGVHVLIPRVCAYYLLWQKKLCTCDYVKHFEVGM